MNLGNVLLYLGYAGDDGEEECAVVMDAYDMADPVNILAKLPGDFYDKIVSHHQRALCNMHNVRRKHLQSNA